MVNVVVMTSDIGTDNGADIGADLEVLSRCRCRGPETPYKTIPDFNENKCMTISTIF